MLHHLFTTRQAHELNAIIFWLVHENQLFSIIPLLPRTLKEINRNGSETKCKCKFENANAFWNFIIGRLTVNELASAQYIAKFHVCVHVYTLYLCMHTHYTDTLAQHTWYHTSHILLGAHNTHDIIQDTHCWGLILNALCVCIYIRVYMYYCGGLSVH